jgi:hypothetical protein
MSDSSVVTGALASNNIRTGQYECNESVKTGSKPEGNNENDTHQNDDDEIKTSSIINNDRLLKRKQSLEAQVTSGCGGGRKKQRIVEAFYGTMWPILEDAGWIMVSDRRYTHALCS